MTDEKYKDLWFHLAEKQAAQKEADYQKAIAFLKTNQVPTPPEIIRIIHQSKLTDKFILQNHVFWEEYKIREGLDTLLEVGQSAFTGIRSHTAALLALKERHENFTDNVDRIVTIPLQKDLIAYCTAALGYSAAVLKLKSRRPDIKAKIEQTVAYNFSDEVSAFLKKLRNKLAHGDVTTASWTILQDKSGQKAEMVFHAEELLTFSEWGTKAEKFIKSARKGRIDVAETIEQYNKGWLRCARGIHRLIVENALPEENDYFNIKDSYSMQGKALMAGLLLAQVGTNLNPYHHLDKYFKPEEIREILRKPMYSKEQIDFMIGLKAAEIHIDDNLRTAIYKRFELIQK